MKTSQFERLSRKYLLPHLPGFCAKGRLMFIDPPLWVLRAFAFDPSAFGKNFFYLEVFVQPLYIPRSHLVYSFGRRLSHGWDMPPDREAEVMNEILVYIKHEGVPFLDAMHDPAALAEKVQLISSNQNDAHVLETMTYSYILIGEYDNGLGSGAWRACPASQQRPRPGSAGRASVARPVATADNGGTSTRG
jgi:hypothetical protein